jgi:hypothetical protein
MKTPGLEEIRKSLDQLATTAPDKLQKVMADQIKLLIVYYEEVIGQSEKSFRSAMFFASLGFLFFVTTVVFLLTQHIDQAEAIISVISGSLVEVVSGVNFYLYKQASNQLSEFHSRLDQNVRFMLANSIAEGMGALKEQTLSELVKLIAKEKED